MIKAVGVYDPHEEQACNASHTHPFFSLIVVLHHLIIMYIKLNRI